MQRPLSVNKGDIYKIYVFERILKTNSNIHNKYVIKNISKHAIQYYNSWNFINIYTIEKQLYFNVYNIVDIKTHIA